MKRFLVILSITVTGLLLSLQTANAQNQLSWEIRTGVDLATQKLGGTDLNTGFGFDILFSYRFMPHTSAYGGWGWHQFTSDDLFAGSKMDFEETGYALGLEFLHPIGDLPLDFYLRGGGLYNHIEVENSDGSITSDSGHGLGWQAGIGIIVDLGNRWQFKPGARYRSLSRNIEVGNTTTDVDLTYFNLAIGIARRL